MRCPECGADSYVVDTREPDPDIVRRRRKCMNMHSFVTLEKTAQRLAQKDQEARVAGEDLLNFIKDWLERTKPKKIMAETPAAKEAKAKRQKTKYVSKPRPRDNIVTKKRVADPQIDMKSDTTDKP